MQVSELSLWWVFHFTNIFTVRLFMQIQIKIQTNARRYVWNGNVFKLVANKISEQTIWWASIRQLYFNRLYKIIRSSLWWHLNYTETSCSFEYELSIDYLISSSIEIDFSWTGALNFGPYAHRYINNTCIQRIVAFTWFLFMFIWFHFFLHFLLISERNFAQVSILLINRNWSEGRKREGRGIINGCMSKTLCWNVSNHII